MKRIVVILLTMFVLITNTCFGSSLVDNYISEDVFKFSEKEEGILPYIAVSADRMIVDRNVNKSGLMISGKNIEIDNIMSNNQFIIGSDTVRINGNLENAIIFAPKVIVNGTVKNLYTFTENLNITSEGNIMEDLILFSGDLNIEGNINGSVIGNAANVNIKGNISNDLRIYTDKINIADSNIYGKVLIKSYNDIAIPAKFQNKEFIKLKQVEHKININFYSIILTYVVVGILYYLINNKNKRIDNLVNNFKANFGKIVLSGALTIMFMPLIVLVSILMWATGINIIPTILLVLSTGILILGFSVSYFLIALLIDKKIFAKYENLYNKEFNKVVTLIVTSIIINLSIYIPVIGGILSMVYGIISVGILFINLFSKKNIKE